MYGEIRFDTIYILPAVLRKVEVVHFLVVFCHLTLLKTPDFKRRHKKIKHISYICKA